MFSIIVVVVAFLLSVIPLFKWYVKRSKFARAINAVPGPKSYPLIGTTYYFFGVERKMLFRVYHQLHDAYPIITRNWIGPLPQVELKRAEHVEKILSASKQHLEKSWAYDFLRYWLGDGLLTSSGEKWHSHRKIITPTFHFSILESFCDIFTEKSNILVKKLSRYADTGKTIDIYPYITKAALDIIAEAAMGTPVNAQDENENEYVTAVYRTTELLVRRMVRPWLHPEFIYKRTADHAKLFGYLQYLHGFTKSVIRKSKANRQHRGNSDNVSKEDTFMGKKKRLAFLDLLLETNEKDGSLSDDDIREEVDTFMFEGHDTTTAGITWAIFLLGLHPKIQEDVFEELDGIFQGSDRAATIQDLNDMKLLERVIKESLRLYPPVPTIARSLSEDVQIDQYTIPKGCTVTIEIVHLHQDERYFPDSHKFDPDRFLPENTMDRHPYAYLPFSAGARNCIGQKFALYEEKAVLSSIVRNYRFKTVGTREDLHPIFELILRPFDGVPLVLEKRVK